MSELDGVEGIGVGSANNQQVHRVEYTRSDVATTRRALSDLENQASKLGEQISRQISTADTANMDEFKAAWDNRDALNTVNKQIASVRDTLSSMMPADSTARLSQQERTQIQGLYTTGLYTQTQLAAQYNVSQPTIGEIVKPKDRT
ncbi:hypothetical protein [Rahnella aceris]